MADVLNTRHDHNGRCIQPEKQTRTYGVAQH